MSSPVLFCFTDRKGDKRMSENVKRVGRDLIYRGAIIEVYQDHMEFANGNEAD